MCYGPNKEFPCWVLPDGVPEEPDFDLEEHIANLIAEQTFPGSSNG